MGKVKDYYHDEIERMNQGDEPSSEEEYLRQLTDVWVNSMISEYNSEIRGSLMRSMKVVSDEVLRLNKAF